MPARLVATVALFGSICSVALAQPSKPAQPLKPAQPIVLGGAVEHPGALTLADLQKQPATREAVYLHTGRGSISGIFTGVLLWTLLQEAGVKLDPAKKNDIIRHTVTITGADGYSAVLSLGEISPEFGGAQAIVAYQVDGAPLDGGEDFVRLIVPGDKGAGRAIGNVASIEVQ